MYSSAQQLKRNNKDMKTTNVTNTLSRVGSKRTKSKWSLPLLSRRLATSYQGLLDSKEMRSQPRTLRDSGYST